VSGETFGGRDLARRPGGQELPSRGQLMAWAMAAERRVLTADESRLLQVGITNLAALGASADARARELSDELRRTQRQLAACMVRAASGLSVACRYCGAGVGELCVSQVDGSPLVEAHTARVYELQCQLGVAS